MSSKRVVRSAIAATAIAAMGMAAAPSGASAHTAYHHRPHAHHHVRTDRYDSSMLSLTNHARSSNSRHSYVMRHRLNKIAHHWAAHLGKVGYLEHNPNLVSAVGRACPHWTSMGENVGEQGGGKPSKLFSAYMHSPEHRANILDSSYTVIGIATVSVTKHGHTTKWNVMDFANHCG